MQCNHHLKGVNCSQSGSSLDYSSDINAISMELADVEDNPSINGLKYLPLWPAVNIEFSGLTYEVPDQGNGKTYHKSLANNSRSIYTTPNYW